MSEERSNWGETDAEGNQPLSSITKELHGAEASDSIWYRIFVGEGGLPAVWGLLIFLGIAFLILTFTGSILVSIRAVFESVRRTASGKPMTVMVLLWNDGLPLFAVTIATWIMSRFEHRSIGAYGFGGTGRFKNFVVGFGWGILFLSLAVGSLWRAKFLVFDGRVLFGGDIVKNAVVWMGGFLLVALFEEYAMRGYLQFTLARGLQSLFESLFDTTHGKALGFWTSAVILSFLFGYEHRSNAGESVIGLWSAGLIGLIFCLTLWRTGSLFWALGFHASWDWAQSFVFGVADSGTMVEGHLMGTHPVGKVLLSGGATGPEGSALILPVMVVIVVVAVWTLPRQEWPVDEVVG